jgi:NAD(P)-dependent dehydrogenase (short-subunit alcohol dehydrogenase family)
MGYESLDGKIALITGGSEGIGYGIAEAFLQAGAHIAIMGRSPNKLQAAKEKLGQNVLTISADITRVELCPVTLSAVLEGFGKLDVLVNNVGTGIFKPLSQSSMDDYDDIFNTNVRGLFALTQAAIPELRKTRGNIINISSVSGMRAMPEYSVYSASKAAVNMLTQLWAKELAPEVRVNSISPGAIYTPLNEKYGENKEAILQEIGERHLMKKIGQPDDIGRAALYLATENWVTGINLVVDGGLYNSKI